MRLARPGVLLLATIIAAPALWQGFVSHGTDESTAMIRYLIAVPVAAVMLMVMDWLVAAYGPDEDEEPSTRTKITVERRRDTDLAPAAGEETTAADHGEQHAELPAGHDRPAG